MNSLELRGIFIGLHACTAYIRWGIFIGLHACTACSGVYSPDCMHCMRRGIFIGLYTMHCMRCADYSISINDHNYYALEVTKERLFTAREKAQTKQWQFNMARRQVSTKQNKFARQTMILTKICNGFLDILPLRMYPQRPDSNIPLSHTRARTLPSDVSKNLQNHFIILSQSPILQKDILG